jgi:hypothetical protein
MSENIMFCKIVEEKRLLLYTIPKDYRIWCIWKTESKGEKIANMNFERSF